ncbi:ribonuclease H-like protein [Mycena floridula]|nr:ribonuclease H-like protein [Mycena floridula]
MLPDTQFDDDEGLDGETVFTDGSAVGNGAGEVSAGAGIFIALDDPRNRSIKIPDELGPSNQVGEVVAVKEAVETLPARAELQIISDSKYTIDSLTKNNKKGEDLGWLTSENGPLLKKTTASIRKRKAATYFKWVKGHSGVPGNEEADRAADAGRQKEQPDLIDMHIDDDLLVTGAKLQCMTQSIAYKLIRKLKLEDPDYQEALDRKATNRMVSLAQSTAEAILGTKPSRKQLWRSVRNKDTPRSIRFFLWMLLHDGYKVGHHWDKIPTMADRGICSSCGTAETLDHILTKCDVPGQRQIWDLVSEMWMLKSGEELRPPLGEIMICGLKQNNGANRRKVNRGTERLRRILISESAHLIWRIRNERAINGKDPLPRKAIRARWVITMNNRIKLDCLLTNKTRYGTKAIQKSLVLSTWNKVIANENALPEDWTRETGALVGVG